MRNKSVWHKWGHVYGGREVRSCDAAEAVTVSVRSVAKVRCGFWSVWSATGRTLDLGRLGCSSGRCSAVNCPGPTVRSGGRVTMPGVLARFLRPEVVDLT